MLLLRYLTSNATVHFDNYTIKWIIKEEDELNIILTKSLQISSQ